MAWRYLFAKKSHNAINLISAISAMGVMVITAALVCVMSVMNGFNTVIEGLFSAFDAELKIVPKEGKYISDADSLTLLLTDISGVELVLPTIEEKALIRYEEKQVPILVKGVDDRYNQLTAIDSILLDGEFAVTDFYDDDYGISTRAFERCVLGSGVAARLGVSAHFVGAIRFFAPKRFARINLMMPERSLNDGTAYIAGVFAVGQPEYDDQYAIVSLPLARQLFDIEETEATAIEIKLSNKANIKTVKKSIQTVLGSSLKVLDRYEQQTDYFRIMKVEKLLTLLLLAFILLIACFNIIGSLSMLMIEKQTDTSTLVSLGANNSQIRRIFLFEGWLICLLGALIGLVAGTTLCLLQQHFGFITLGNGEDYIISAYPVQVQVLDLLAISLIVIILGFISAFIPTKYLSVKHL